MNPTDQMNCVHPLQVAKTAFGIASLLQTTKPGEQVLALSLLFLLMTEELGLPVIGTLQKTKRIMADTDEFDQVQVAALRQLIREEYRK